MTVAQLVNDVKETAFMKNMCYSGLAMTVLCWVASLQLMFNQSMLQADNNQAFWRNSPYLDMKSYTSYEYIRSLLIRDDGFVQDAFLTVDGLLIDCLIKQCPQADYTFILCAGWLPGKAEGMAGIYALLPKNCNVLLFNSRGHGGSQGSLMRSMWSYGEHEYKDVIAAIEYAHQISGKPIVIIGVCAGAFHAAHALARLTKQGRIEELNVKGLVFDSGWSSVSRVSLTVPNARINEIIARMVAKIKRSHYRQEKNSWPARALSSIVQRIYGIFHTMGYRPFITEGKTNLFKYIKQIGIPMLFIHSYDDDYAVISDVKRLAQCVQQAECWWIDKPSKHACHFLKHTQEYQRRIIHFFDTIA